MNAIEIKNLTKSYGDFRLDNLSLTLPSGCIMGLVGENGAGKSTTMKLLLGMIRKDDGSITLLGRENEEELPLTKQEIGVVMDEVGLPECLHVAQVGKIMKYTYQNWDEEMFSSLVRRLSLPEKKPFGDYSRGMKMKLGLAIALSHNSKLLLLDEATSGLDPVVRDEVVGLLHDFTRDEDHSILISSHIVSDLEKLCDYIAFLHHGKLLLCEEKDQLLGEYGLIRCTQEQLSALDPTAVRYRKDSPYGVEALVLRSKVPGSVPVSPVTLEELFVFMVKGEC